MITTRNAILFFCCTVVCAIVSIMSLASFNAKFSTLVEEMPDNYSHAHGQKNLNQYAVTGIDDEERPEEKDGGDDGNSGNGKLKNTPNMKEIGDDSENKDVDSSAAPTDTKQNNNDVENGLGNHENDNEKDKQQTDVKSESTSHTTNTTSDNTSDVGEEGGEEEKKAGSRISCDWFPDNTLECDEMLKARLPLGKPLDTSDDFIRKRWLFLGDSTMKHLFTFSPLRKQLLEEPLNSLTKRKPHECWQQDEQTGLICQHMKARRCGLNELFGLPSAPYWSKPDPSFFEGPVKFGLKGQNCRDCFGCESDFLDCHVKDMELAANYTNLRSACTRKHFTYGGYITIEFARDVEIQTPEYNTTQENTAAYIHERWNSPGSSLVQQWGLPICVINTGAHDIMVENVTVNTFIKNVDWYLNLFVSECSHFIWLSNTAPLDDESDYPQTQKSMGDYNEAVEKLLTHSRDLNRMSSYINIFDATLNWTHADHIHMDKTFYHKFGEWMVETFMNDITV